MNLELNTIYNENCFDTMERMTAGRCNVVLTSPFYNTNKKQCKNNTLDKTSSKTGFPFVRYDTHIDNMTDIQRAARYHILIRGSFGAKKESFATDVTNIAGKFDYLSEIQNRLQRVVIEHNDFEKLIKTYDRPGALFYLDPPYYAAEKYYNSKFSLADHERLLNVLKGIKGKFILSYNADNAILEMYKDFNIIPVTRFNQLSSTSNNKEYKEVIIKNF